MNSGIKRALDKVQGPTDAEPELSPLEKMVLSHQALIEALMEIGKLRHEIVCLRDEKIDKLAQAVNLHQVALTKLTTVVGEQQAALREMLKRVDYLDQTGNDK